MDARRTQAACTSVVAHLPGVQATHRTLDASQQGVSARRLDEARTDLACRDEGAGQALLSR
jgi:hypothetical protein